MTDQAEADYNPAFPPVFRLRVVDHCVKLFPLPGSRPQWKEAHCASVDAVVFFRDLGHMPIMH